MVDATGTRNGENDPMKAIMRDAVDGGSSAIDRDAIDRGAIDRGTIDRGAIEMDAGKIDKDLGGIEQHAGAVGPGPVPAAMTPPPRFDLSHRPVLTRAQQIALTLDTAMDDAAFHAHVTRADAARDCGDWPLAEQEYGLALRRFPLHWGYCIQYAHVIKEQQFLTRAEIWYRSAVALGAAPDMVDLHLAFVAQRNGARFVRDGMPRLDVPPIMAPPTAHDIGTLGDLTRVPGLADDDLVLDLLRTAPTNRAVLLHMLGMPGFVQANRTFLAVLGGLA
jgi:hypothetical protein